MHKGTSTHIRLLPLAVIIPFLAFFFYSIALGRNPVQVIYSNIVTTTPSVRYDTFTLSFDSSVPQYLKESIKSSLEDINYNGIQRFEFKESGDYVIESSNSSEDFALFSTTLVPVGHIYWIGDSVTTEDIKSRKVSVLLEDESYDKNEMFLRDFFDSDIDITKSASILDDLEEDESSIAFVEPSSLTKEMKILKFNGKNFLNSEDGKVEASYIFTSEKENSDFVYSIVSKNITKVSSESIDSEDIVKINMTGVTAITRGLAVKMDALQDWDYPAQDIGEFLADADLTHVSNEISFVDGCTSYSGMRFCSKPEYIKTLQASGVDIVELTGNHNNDFGATNNTNTINTYKELGLDYFGGGLDIDDANKILYKEVKGNSIAFIGYNYYDTMQRTGAIATSSHAGSNSYSVEKLKSDVEEAKENADVVVVTFQFQECYSYPSSDVIYPICYKPLSNPDQKKVFRQAVDFGADIVIGTQAHQPQTYEVYKGGTIFYGLGNLYFDQTRWIGTRHGLVLSLYVLDGEVIQTELTPTIYEKDMITRLADADESNVLLEQLKSARNF